jgi:predicted N-acyltransferase
MDFDVQIAHSVTEIGQETWDRLSPAQPFTSYRWYRFGETVLTDDIPIYIILSLGGETVARATFWVKRQEPLPVKSKALRHLLEAILRRWPLMICRAPLSSSSGLILPDPPLRDAAMRIIAEVAQELGRQNKASFLLFDYLERRETDWDGWPEIFMPTAVPDPGTYLVIAWPDFESYLKHRPKSVRKDYRRHRNRAADLGVVVTPHETVTAIDEAMVLIRNVERRYNSPPNPWARPMLENAPLVDAAWLTAEVEGRLVGCGLLLGEGDTRFLRLLGLDYNVRYIYFQLVYAAIRCAIEEGIRILRGGSGGYEMKRRLGFQLERDNYVVFTGRGPLLQRLGRWMAASNV